MLCISPHDPISRHKGHAAVYAYTYISGTSHTLSSAGRAKLKVNDMKIRQLEQTSTCGVLLIVLPLIPKWYVA
jgi:hypothetical protein